MVKLVDRRYGYLLIYIMVFTLTTVPITSPISILEWTRSLYDYVDTLPPGSLILYSGQYGSAGPTFQPFAMAFLYHCMRNNLRLVGVCPSLIFIDWLDLDLHASGWLDPGVVKPRPGDTMSNGKTYGTDFVYLGFLPGQEAGLANLAKDSRMVYKLDYYGNDIETLPIMQDFRSAEDIDLVLILFDYYPVPISWVRQWRPYGTPIGLAHYASPGPYLPYYYAGDYIGISSDIDGGSQYETLVGKPGLATALTTLSSTLHLLQAVVIIAGSVVLYATKFSGREES